MSHKHYCAYSDKLAQLGNKRMLASAKKMDYLVYGLLILFILIVTIGFILNKIIGS